MGSHKKAWSARFDLPVSELMHGFNASLPFDRRLAPHDIRASIAHARMLGAQAIIPAAESAAIIAGLEQLAVEIAAGNHVWDEADEDVHGAVERVLTERIGDAGKRLHTARSRNDQVSTDLRLWLREEIDAQLGALATLRVALLDQALVHVETIMPGMTHLQIAQPTTLAHHLHAHACMLERDSQRLRECRARVNLLPLGAAAFAGTSFPVDPDAVATELGFAGLCPNTMDAVADRDFAIESAAAAALLMVHLSRLCEEIVIWSSQPFGFVRVADAYCTGSSIMPQKRNPDAAELVRGKAGRVVGHAVALLLMAKGQPLAYNKDNQEDKEALFDCVDTVRMCLAVMAGMVNTLEFNRERMAALADTGFATATDLADHLVRNGMPFRDAHGVVAAAVKAAEARQVSLAGLADEELTQLADLPVAGLRQALDAAAAVRNRAGPGAPAPASLQPRLECARTAAAADLPRRDRECG